MATSGSYNTSAYAPMSRYLTFSWSVKSQSIDNNQTVISWTLKGNGGNTAHWVMCYNTELRINNKVVFSKSAGFQLYNGTSVASGEYTISHDAEGNASFNSSCVAGFYYTTQDYSGSGSWDLQQIARASVPTLSSSSITLNGSNSITITTNRKSTNFTHVITYSFGEQSGTISSSAGASVSWTPSIGLITEFPTSSSKSGTISCATYSGSSKIGDTKSVSFTLKNPGSTQPKASATTINVNGTNSLTITMSRTASSFTHDLSYSFNGTTGTIATNQGTSYSWTIPTSILSAIPTTTAGKCTITCKTKYNSTQIMSTKTVTVNLQTTAVPTITASFSHGDSLTSYLRYLSKVKISGSASASPGSSISSIKITNDGKQIGTAFGITVSNLTVKTIVINVTDARGQSATRTLTLSPWVDYVMPTISVKSVKRVSNISTTSNAVVEIGGNVYRSTSSLSNSYSVTMTTSLGSQSFSLSPTTSNTYTLSATLTKNFARNTSYPVTIKLQDSYTSVSVKATILDGRPIIHVGNNPQKHFDIEGDLIIHGNSSSIKFVSDDGNTTYAISFDDFAKLIIDK